ncbi:SIMPL domain-containing protein [Flavobacterium sp. 17A]|uniref:SIMPL domain-containing protein n=1 Tax=Flavobacterium potami TaxID=2872310 RepID=A0A9X1H6M3_9FLAO|nr:SIMPL domain-containing protein [Flavobacterium potami]MBZ4033177.1 SIMPL domain-containing protein [Flavobacterium potami]
MKQLLFALLAFATVNSFSQTKNSIDKPFIEVSGQADTLVVPNKIWINVLLSEKDSKGKKSVEDLEKEMLSKLKEIGINIEKDVTVNDMSSNFKNYLLKQNDIFKSKSYSIIVKNAIETSKVFVGLEKIGVSNVRIEKIENTDKKKIVFSLNAKAILDAKQRAESFTKALNQKVGNVQEITSYDDETNNTYARIISRNINRYEAESTPEEPNIEFEKIKITSIVKAKFLIE